MTGCHRGCHRRACQGSGWSRQRPGGSGDLAPGEIGADKVGGCGVGVSRNRVAVTMASSRIDFWIVARAESSGIWSSPEVITWRWRRE